MRGAACSLVFVLTSCSLGVRSCLLCAQELATYSDDDFASDGGYEDEYDEDQNGNVSDQLAREHIPDPAVTTNNNLHSDAPVDADETEAAGFHKHSETSSPELDQEATQATDPGQSEADRHTEPALDPVEQPEPAADLAHEPDDTKSNDSSETTLEVDSTKTQANEQLPVETERIPTRDESTAISSPGDGSVSSDTSPVVAQAPSPHAPPRIGQQPRPGTFRSLSTPVVPALSLGDPDALASRYTRSTSVPSVVSSDAPEFQGLCRFPIESISSSLSSSRIKSFQRLPSVVEIQAPDDASAGAESDADDDESENDESDDTSHSRSNVPAASFTVSNVQRGRSSSIQMSPPTLMISPVTRANSQPFMSRLPSVIELTAEESAAIESMRNSDDESEDDDKDSDRSDPDDSDTEDQESEGTPSIDLIALPPSIDLDTAAAADLGPAEAVCKASRDELSEIDAGPAALQPDASTLNAEEDRKETSPAADMEALVLASHDMNEPAHDKAESSDEYEDEYDGSGDSDASEQSRELAHATNRTEHDEEADETDAIPDPTTSRSPEEHNNTDDNNDDDGDVFEAEEDDDDVFDLGFEEENRRETESLLREAHLLLQKQHDDESRNASSGAQSGEALAAVDEQGSRESTKEIEIATTNAASVEEPVFDDHYGGEDFANSDDDNEEEQNEFDAYASDNDDPIVVREDPGDAHASTAQDTGEAAQVAAASLVALVPSADDRESSNECSSAAVSSSDATSGNNASSVAPSEATQEENSLASPASNADSTLSPQSQATEATSMLSADTVNHKVESDPSAQTEASPVEQQAPAKATRPDSTKVATRPPAARPTQPAAPVAAANSTTPRNSRPTRSVPERAKVESLPEPKRERPRDLRLRTERAGRQADVCSHASPPSSSAASSPRFQSPRVLSRPSSEHHHAQSTYALSPEAAPPAPEAASKEVPPVSPTSDARRSPERVPTVYTPRVYIESYELPPRKAPVFKQPRVKKSRADEARRKLLMPVKSPPNLRIELPTMDKTKRNWLLLNMFRHGDDVSKYEAFVPKLAAPSAPPQSARRPARPSSAALQQTYASSQADAIRAYRGSRSSRNGRKLVQQDPVLRERERNWAAVKPHESAIPAYDSILDKFCTTVTSPVVQRQIYETRHDDLSPQLAYVLERRVERQWKSDITEAFGAPSASYRADAVSPRGAMQ